MTDPAQAPTKSMPGVPGRAGVVVDRLTVRYGATAAVSEVSLEVRRGELFFLLGPSGCGKTSLLRAIGGLEPAASGSVAIGGRDVSGLPAYRRGAPMVFQGYALWPHLTLLENAAYGLEARGLGAAECRAKALAALKLVGLAERADARPAQLSGGQQQRVALARALACEPEVVLLDEPLSNLDAKLRREMRTELVRLHAEAGFTAIYVTHDQEEALSMAERLAVMHAGRIVELGSPRELYERPRERFTAEFLGEVNWLPAEVLGDAPGGGGVRVRTALGEAVVDNRVPGSEFLVPSSGPATRNQEPGTRNWLIGFRPESARVGPGPAGALPWRGRVRSASFLGSEERVELTANGSGPALHGEPQIAESRFQNHEGRGDAKAELRDSEICNRQSAVCREPAAKGSDPFTALVLRLPASGARAGQELAGHVEPGRLWLFPA